MKTLNFNDKLLSIKDVSEILNLSVPTVKRFIYDGSLPSVKVGSSRRVQVDDVKKFVNNSPSQKQNVKKTDLKIIPGYMGIKTQILDHIHLEINKIANKGDIILDIFAGSGAVSYELKRDFVVYANDIEPYSCTVNNLLINNSLVKKDIINFDIVTFEKNYEKNLKKLQSMDSNSIRLDVYKKNHSLFPYALFTSYFSDTYFSKLQGQQIDSLRYAIDQSDKKYKDLLLSCLIFCCYQTVTSVGSHFAQPKIVKAKNQKDIDNKRQQDAKKYFFRKFDDIKENLYIDKKKNKVFCEDFNQLLSTQNKMKDVSVTYIDPPYTIDHYSRFYHILNTLVLYDYPEKTGKGQYREGRYQSNFCIKSKAKKELDTLVSKISKLGSKIIMSYSDSYRSILKSDEIIEIFKKYYQENSVNTPIKIEYSYSGFGRSSFNRANELLFIATKPKK